MAKTITAYHYPDFIAFCSDLVAQAKLSNYFDFEVNRGVVSQRTSKHSAWPIVGFTLTTTKPVTDIKELKPGSALTIPTRKFLNFIQLSQPDIKKDLNIIGVHKSGYVVVAALKGITIPKPVPKLAFKTNLKATAAIGDKLSVEWSGGVAPYSVKVTDDKGAVIVDYVDLKTATKYDYDTTGKTAGSYQIFVKDSAASEIGSIVSVVS
ncbi:TPA: hypothetical protein JG872_000347 [Enterobacter hormaechei subsp. xiangfangensis]|nr:hypothetical protein [Enterobacter hormaechei subsp. xiangfangensis]HAV1860653.1 hypothetical protein [Enterobacter hormaechei subsp. xiangfangensis]